MVLFRRLFGNPTHDNLSGQVSLGGKFFQRFDKTQLSFKREAHTNYSDGNRYKRKVGFKPEKSQHGDEVGLEPSLALAISSLACENFAA